jgi:hypothetical protein
MTKNLAYDNVAYIVRRYGDGLIPMIEAHSHKFLYVRYVLFIALTFSSTGTAQDTNGSFLTAISGGYTYISGHLSAPPTFRQPSLLPSRNNFNGWHASVGIRISRFVAITGDFTNAYGSQPSTHAAGEIFTFVGGPRFALRFGKFTPFVEGFFGGTLTRDSEAKFPILANPCSGCEDAVAFADNLGGGVAYRLTHKLDWYLRTDLVQTNFDVATQPLPRAALQNSLQVSTGIAFRFCAARDCTQKQK